LKEEIIAIDPTKIFSTASKTVDGIHGGPGEIELFRSVLHPWPRKKLKRIWLSAGLLSFLMNNIYSCYEY